MGCSFLLTSSHLRFLNSLTLRLLFERIKKYSWKIYRSLHLPRTLLSFTHSLSKQVIFLYSPLVNVDNLAIKRHRFFYSQITPKLHKTLWRPCFQSGLLIPKVSKVLLQSNREFNGLSALGRNLELKTSVTIVSSPA